jgi:hypothetical protein
VPVQWERIGNLRFEISKAQAGLDKLGRQEGGKKPGIFNGEINEKWRGRGAAKTGIFNHGTHGIHGMAWEFEI